ncbi:MAG: hypothetical protein ABW168_11590 [Sedimenticola sp.]
MRALTHPAFDKLRRRGSDQRITDGLQPPWRDKKYQWRYFTTAPLPMSGSCHELVMDVHSPVLVYCGLVQWKRNSDALLENRLQPTEHILGFAYIEYRISRGKEQKSDFLLRPWGTPYVPDDCTHSTPIHRSPGTRKHLWRPAP